MQSSKRFLWALTGLLSVTLVACNSEEETVVLDASVSQAADGSQPYDGDLALDQGVVPDLGTSSDAGPSSDSTLMGDSTITIPDGAIHPDDPVSIDDNSESTCPNTCILADGTCAPFEMTNSGFCGRAGQSCLASCNTCDERYDSLGFPMVYDVPPDGCDDCVGFETFCDSDGNGEVDPEKAGVGVTLCMDGGGPVPGEPNDACMFSTPAQCPCDCCANCGEAQSDTGAYFECSDGPQPMGRCQVEGPSSGVVSWIDPVPLLGDEFETLFTQVTDAFCENVARFGLGDCANATPNQLAVIYATIRTALISLAPTANDGRPPQTMQTDVWRRFVESKQYRAITRLNKTLITCNDGRIESAIGQDFYYDHHGYTPLPSGVRPVFFEAGVGQVVHVYPSGTPIGRSCLRIRHEHRFYIAGPGAVVADFLSGPFEVPIPYHLFETELCCPNMGEADGRYSLEIEASDFPSHQGYLDDRASRLRFQSGLGDFMFSNPHDMLRLAPGSPLSSVEQAVPCIPINN